TAHILALHRVDHGIVRVSESGFALETWLIPRLDAKHRTRLFVREHIQQPVRALPDISNPLPEFSEEGLPAQFLHFFVEQNALEMSGSRNLAGPQRSDEHISLPLRQ